MKYPKFILLSTIFIIIGIAIFGSIFVYRGGRPQSSSDLLTPDSLSTNVITPKNTIVDAVPQEIDKETTLEACVETETRKIGEIKYEKGSILVSFKSSATFSDALEVIESNNLKYQSREAVESDFETNHWLGVIVPKGEEFRWICKLKENKKVKNAVVNRILDLHL